MSKWQSINRAVVILDYQISQHEIKVATQESIPTGMDSIIFVNFP
jgi:hypothetical protein